MRVKKLLMKVLGFCSETVIRDWQLAEPDGQRPRLTVWIRAKVRRRGPCGRCGESASFYDQGGGERRWRHIDVGHATCEVVADARRVDQYLTVVCDHFTGKVIWAHEGRSKATVHKFFDQLGADRCAELGFVTSDGAEWIRLVGRRTLL